MSGTLEFLFVFAGIAVIALAVGGIGYARWRSVAERRRFKKHFQSKLSSPPSSRDREKTKS